MLEQYFCDALRSCMHIGGTPEDPRAREGDGGWDKGGYILHTPSPSHDDIKKYLLHALSQQGIYDNLPFPCKHGSGTTYYMLGVLWAFKAIFR